LDVETDFSGFLRILEDSLDVKVDFWRFLGILEDSCGFLRIPEDS